MRATLDSLTLPIMATDLLVIVLATVSAYFVFRQRESPWRLTRELLLAFCFLWVGIAMGGIWTALDNTPAVLTQATMLVTGLVLASVAVMSVVGFSIYYQSSPYDTSEKGSPVAFLRERIFVRTPMGILAIFTTCYIISGFLFLVIFKPFAAVSLRGVFGGTIESTSFSPAYLSFLLGVVLLTVLNPLVLLLKARTRWKEKNSRNFLLAFPLAWLWMGVCVFMFDAYFADLGVETSSLGYLFAGVAFAIIANEFRGVSHLAIFLQSGGTGVASTESSPFTNRLNAKGFSIAERSILLEVDPLVNFEVVVRDYAVEALGNGYRLFAFTTKGGPVYRALARVEGAKFFIMTGRVSSPRRTEECRGNEMLVPKEQTAVLLDLLDETSKTGGGGRVGVIFDSITDTILTLGPDAAYKFVRQANESGFESRLTALFLMTAGAQDEKTVNVVRSLFQNQVSCDSVGLRLRRKAQFFSSSLTEKAPDAEAAAY